jgi:hypothetical protein
MCRLQVSNKVTPFRRYPFNKPRRNLIRIYVELVDSIIRIFFSFISIYLIQFLHVDPIVLPDMKGQRDKPVI